MLLLLQTCIKRFPNLRMIEEEEMEKQVNDDTFDECAYVKDDDDLCA